jgi:site-specific recombinase XerC
LFATYYLENDGSLETQKEILGHENIKTTEVYAEITLKKMAKKINQYADI